ncbi:MULTISPECIES: hypothetical protein [Deinococcus]|uniref:Tetratricopeptide repeat protein n=1 Tax=Deinococcus rufus TaxID=2136097 RepID=A0ABV7Z7A4_9DEIO|nr:hypothetical protein [Deinococcus sp. AB2017081]WQE97192.1 hypothetical protein U2P90_19165 [Deinococcus sp. AB2017081]
MPRSLLALSLLFSPPTLAAPAFQSADLSPGGAALNALAAESYRRTGVPGDLATWLDVAYLRAHRPLAGGATLDQALSRRRAQLLAAPTPAQKDRLARETAAWAHALIKRAVPKFSLERGFELANFAASGERQCLSQSTVIAGLLQRAGLDAGLAMVWTSMAGQVSNLGHVTSVLRLPSGAGDLEVDASEPGPIATHPGVLAWTGSGYRFLKATFGPGGLITAYTPVGQTGPLRPAQTHFLSLAYIRSQYSYYRAERAPGGVLGTGTGRATTSGLQTSVRLLQEALALEPHNALAASVLGTVWRKQGHLAQAREQYLRAAALYAAQGYTPAGQQVNLQWAHSPVK